MFVINSLGLIDPAGIAYLSAIARDLGHDRYLCILQEQDLLEHIKAVRPDVLAYSFNSCEASAVIKAHRSQQSGIFSVMGGTHPTLYPDSLVESGADAYCVGEGELAFRDLLLAIDIGKPIDGIPNIHTLKQRNDVRELVDLATLPMPDRDLVLSVKRLSKYPRKMFLTSRGCPYRCTYCFNSSLERLYRGKGKWVRRFPVGHVIGQIKNVRANHALRFVKFDDDNFAFRRDAWLEEFAIRYKKEIGLPFNCLIRLESADDALLDLLQDMGCYSITTSVDSANQQIREGILKRTSTANSQILEAMWRIRAHGINLFVNYITGIPSASEHDELETLKLNCLGHVTYANYTTLVPFHGTELWDYCQKRGLYSSIEIPRSLLKPTQLAGFSKRQIRTQRNVLMLGAYSSVVRTKILIWVVNLPTNGLFKLLYSFLKSWRISTKIYRPEAGLWQQLGITVKATVSDLRDL